MWGRGRSTFQAEGTYDLPADGTRTTDPPFKVSPLLPTAVLIRRVLIDGVDPKRTNGPGKVTRILGLDHRHHGLHLADADCPLHLEPPTGRPRLERGLRVSVDCAGPVWAGKAWRWWADGFPAVR